MRITLILAIILLLPGCLTVYECEGDHKETYNNISPTTQASDTTTTPTASDADGKANPNPNPNKGANNQAAIK